jgi:hypothetical protein
MSGLQRILILLLLVGLWPVTGSAQARTAERLVGDIAIEFVDIRNVSDEAILAR